MGPCLLVFITYNFLLASANIIEKSENNLAVIT